jgi:hypothetical protein
VLEVVAVGDAVDAVDARGVEALEPRDHVLQLGAPGGGEARQLDLRPVGRETRRARLLARGALVGRPRHPRGRILELGRRAVQIGAGPGIEHVAAVVEQLADRVLGRLDRLLEHLPQRRRLERIEAGRGRGGPADARPALARLERRGLLHRRAPLRLLLGDHRVGPRLDLRHLGLLLLGQLDRLPAQRADEVPHQPSSSGGGGSSASTACPYSGHASLRHSQSCGAPPSSSLAGCPQVGQRGGSTADTLPPEETKVNLAEKLALLAERRIEVGRQAGPHARTIPFGRLSACPAR